MKKLLALGVTTLCALGTIGGAYAVEMTSNTQDVTAEYTIGSSYKVTIPTGIAFSGANTSVDDAVTASDVLINDGEILKISMESANGNLVNGDSYIPYSFTLGETTTDVAAATDYELLSIESGNKTGEEKAITFTAGGLDNVTLAGLHSDTLTFKVNVVSVPTSLIDPRDGKEYTVAQIAGKTWMTENLKFVPEGATWEDDGIYVDGDSGEVFYKHYAALSACPEGWELPTNADFESLTALYDKDTIVSGPFKAVYTGNLVNETQSLPSVVRGNSGAFWSLTRGSGNGYYYLSFTSSIMRMISSTSPTGRSVRCVAE